MSGNARECAGYARAYFVVRGLAPLSPILVSQLQKVATDNGFDQSGAMPANHVRIKIPRSWRLRPSSKPSTEADDLDRPTRNAIERAAQRARGLLETDFAAPPLVP